jgi:hypothetical protein
VRQDGGHLQDVVHQRASGERKLGLQLAELVGVLVGVAAFQRLDLASVVTGLAVGVNPRPRRDSVG